MAHPLATKAISAARVNNDAVDAQTLAHLLRTNLLPRGVDRSTRGPPGPPAEPAPAPGWSACAHGCSPNCTRCSPDLGVIPELTTLFGPAGRRWLAELPMPASARGRLDAGLRLIDAITVEVNHADADLRAAFAGDQRVRRLLPVPGIGLVTAATVVAEGFRHPALPLTAAVVLLGRADPG